MCRRFLLGSELNHTKDESQNTEKFFPFFVIFCSSEYMTLVALFPLPSTRNDSACNLVEEDKEDEEEYCQTRDQIQFVSASNLKANMTTESNPYGMESSTSCLEQCNAMGEAENKIFE